MNQIGKWMLDEAGLPCFAYTGDLPYNAPDDKGQKIRLPEELSAARASLPRKFPTIQESAVL